MNWYGEQRHKWIKEMLRIYGFINRSHIVEKFGCSAQLAGNDLTAFQEANATWVEYNPRRRAYVNLTHTNPRER
ncbi:hypothetical protein [uncultured Roseobacter sp.]|uniref:hypothetical protein n=1 Tax=uncultured Roseobacter sp. TaxID=114847 RepID=UPI002615FC38|nr:hypothetical protein [uncultured Roseobacter sp.]